jgi:type IV pilus assembly protein PilN
MIKINLIKPKISGEGGGGADIALSEDQALRKGGQNLMILLIGPLLFYGYQNFVDIPSKKEEIQRYRSEVQTLKATNDKAKTAVTEMKKFEVDKVKLQARIDSIDDLRKDRMLEVRILDLLQRESPEKLWFKTIDMREDKVLVVGYSAAEAEITQFMDNLTKSGLLGIVSLTSSSERTVDGNVFKEFKIVFPKTPNPPPEVKKGGPQALLQSPVLTGVSV